MPFTRVVIQEQYETATGGPASGSVEFTPIDQMHNGAIVVSSPESDTLDNTGALSIELAATTDPATRPVGVTYRVVERLLGQPVRTYYVAIPHDQGSPLQLGDLPAFTTGGAAGFALRNAVDYDDSTAPTDGQAMVWDTTLAKFHPETITGGSGGVASVNGLTGAVTINNSTLGAQPADSDLTAIAALAPTDGSLLERVAGAWASRTPAQVKGDLALDLVSNTSDAAKPISTAAANALALKAPLADPTFTGTPTAPRFVGSVVAVTYAASVSLNASLGTTFRCVATGNLTVTAVTAGFQGQEIKLEVQASGANRTVTVLGVASTVNSGTWATWLLTYNQGLDQWTQIPPGGGSGGAVTSVNGQTGAVTLTASGVGAQPADSDLTDFAALAPANGDLLERVAGVWSSRSAAQVKADLALDLVNNTSDLSKPLSTAASAALAAKAPLADPAFTGTPTAPRFVGAVATVAYATSITLNAALATVFRVTATGDITSVAITNGAQGQEVKLQVLASGATRTVTAFGVATTVNSGTWATIPFTYNQGLDLWTQDSSGSGGGGAVSSVNGLTGAVTLTAASLSAQPADSDLTAIAALAPTDGSVLERVAGAWTARTPTQIKGDLALDQVNNTSDAAKPLSTAASTALAAKAPLASPTFTGTPTAPRFVGAVVTVPYSPSITLDAAAATTFRCVATGDVALADILNGAPGQTVRLAVRASGAARNVTAAGSITNVPDGQWWVSTFTYDQATDGWIQDPTGGSGGGGGSGAVSSVNGLTGAVTLTAAGLGAQAADSDLTSIAALSPTDGSVLERVGGVWVARTAAQLKADLALDQVSNTADAAKPVSTATQAALDAKAPLAAPTFTGTAAAPRFVGTVVTVAYAASVTLDASAGTVFRCTAPGDLALADITAGVNGQTVRFEVLASGATRTVTASGTATAVPAGQWWVGEFTYNASTTTWLQDPIGGSGGGGGTGAVSSVNGQTGAVTLTATSLSAQPIDSDLTAIAALAPTDGSLLSRQGGAWTGRTTAQVKTDLGVAADIASAVAGLVGSAPGGLDTLGEIATALTADEATAAALATTVAGKAPLASPTFTGTVAAPRFRTPPVTLTASSGSITPDAAASSIFRHTATADVTVNEPLNGVDGQLPLWLSVLASGADRTVSFAGGSIDPVVVASGSRWVGQLLYDGSASTYVLVDNSGSESGGSSGSGVSSVNGQVGAVVLTSDSFTDGTTNHVFTAADDTKLAGIATGATVYTDEQAQDAAAAALAAGTHTGISFAYDDTAGSISATGYTDEQAQDAAAAMVTAGTHTGISFSYDDAANALSATVSGGGGGSYTDEQAQDAAASMITGAAHTGISFSYNDAANTLSAIVSSGGDAAAPYGRVFLDDFAGSTDDAKLSAALTACAADTYPRTITLSNRAYAFANTQTPYTGLRIEGPPGYSNPERVSGTKMGCKIVLTTGTAAGWFHFAPGSSSQIFSTTFRNLSFVGNSSSTVLTNNANGVWYCVAMSGIYTSGLLSVLGTQTQKFLCTAASFTGDWEINNCYSGAFHIGGSDNVFWSDGMLLDSGTAFNTAGSANGQYHLWLDSCEKSYVGPLYLTCEGAWNGIRVSGPAFNSTSSNQGGPINFFGMRVEGRNAGAPCNGAVFRQDGGIVILRDSWLSYGMASPSTPGHSPADAGVIHHAAGTLVVDGCTYDRATGVAETVPWVYTNSNADCIVRSAMRAAKGGTWTGRPRVAKPTANTENRITDATVTLLSV